MHSDLCFILTLSTGQNISVVISTGVGVLAELIIPFFLMEFLKKCLRLMTCWVGIFRMVFVVFVLKLTRNQYRIFWLGQHLEF